jgi:hypothetical protein
MHISAFIMGTFYRAGSQTVLCPVNSVANLNPIYSHYHFTTGHRSAALSDWIVGSLSSGWRVVDWNRRCSPHGRVGMSAERCKCQPETDEGQDQGRSKGWSIRDEDCVRHHLIRPDRIQRNHQQEGGRVSWHLLSGGIRACARI